MVDDWFDEWIESENFLAASSMNGWWLKTKVRRHLASSLADATVIQEDFLAVDLPNLHRAMEHWSDDGNAEVKARCGIPCVHAQLFDSLRESKVNSRAIRYDMVQIGPHKRVRVPQAILYMVTLDGKPAIVWNETFGLLAAGADPEHVERVIERVKSLISKHNLYRGQVLSIDDQSDQFGRRNFGLNFHEVDTIQPDEIILPGDTKALLERSTVDFFKVSDQLVQMGQAGSRGLLLHGSPGTGKTLVTRWLIGELPEITKFLLTGQQLVYLQQTVMLARVLRPSLLILDDVDLIASHRESNPYGSVLHDLMNLMDGLEREDQILFLLTTNRPDAIEEALADRPGRIDQAIEFPLPDEGCRAQLIELFAGRQDLSKVNLPGLVDMCEGTTPAFLRELVRRALQFQLLAGSDRSRSCPQLTDEDFRLALADMTAGSGSLTKRLLGFSNARK